MPDPKSESDNSLDAFVDKSMEGTEDDFFEEEDTTEDSQDGDSEGQEVQETEEPVAPTSEEAASPPTRGGDPENPNNFQRVGHLFADAKGNIVTKDGRIMAARGEAARHWMNMSRQAATAQQYQRQNEILNRQIQGNQQLLAHAQQIANIPTKYGLTAEEFNEGVGIISRFKSNPVEAAREVVSLALAQGVNVTDILGKTAGDALEMSAVRRLIDEATRGQRQQEQNAQAQMRHQMETRERYDQFVARYPDAETHGDAIANLMNTHQLSAVEAYHEVRHFATRHGLDFTQPLAPQIEAARAQQQPNGNGQRRSPQRAPMVSGASGGRSQLTTETTFADADADWSTILNSVLRDSQ